MEKEASKWNKFLNYITSKAFRDTVKGIFVAIVFIIIVVSLYFYFIDYSAKKMKETTGINILKEAVKETSQGIGLSEIDAQAFVEQNRLKARIRFQTVLKANSMAQISGNGRVINQTSWQPVRDHDFIFTLMEKDYNKTLNYFIIVNDSMGHEERVSGKIEMPVKEFIANQTAAKITIG